MTAERRFQSVGAAGTTSVAGAERDGRKERADNIEATHLQNDSPAFEREPALSALFEIMQRE